MTKSDKIKSTNSNLGGGQILLNNKKFCRAVMYINTA